MSVVVVGVDLLWRVEVEMPDWRGWHPLVLRRLRRLLARDEDIVRVVAIRSSWERLLVTSVAQTVRVAVVADSPGAAARRAERALARTLMRLGRSPSVSAWIISTDGERSSSAETRRPG
jgi:hypothetical protein